MNSISSQPRAPGGRAADNRRISLYLEPDSDSDSSSDRSASDGGCKPEDGSSGDSGSDTGSIGPLKAFQRCATEVLAMAAGRGGDVNGGDGGGTSRSGGGEGEPVHTFLASIQFHLSSSSPPHPSQPDSSVSRFSPGVNAPSTDLNFSFRLNHGQMTAPSSPVTRVSSESSSANVAG